MVKPKPRGDKDDFFKSRGQSQIPNTPRTNAQSSEENDETQEYTKGEQAILALMQQLNGKTDQIAQQLTALESKFDSLQTRVAGTERKIASLEKEVTSQEEALKGIADDHRQANVSLIKRQAHSEKRLEALENNARAGNVRILGFPPMAEGEGMMEFLIPFLAEALDIQSEQDFPGIAKAYRIPSRSSQWSESGGGTIMAVFTDVMEKERFMELVKKKRQIRFKDHKILFFPDLCQTTQERRKTLLKYRKELAEGGATASVLYPAKLKVTSEGKSFLFTEVESATNYIENWRREMKDSNG